MISNLCQKLMILMTNLAEMKVRNNDSGDFGLNFEDARMTLTVNASMTWTEITILFVFLSNLLVNKLHAFQSERHFRDGG